MALEDDKAIEEARAEEKQAQDDFESGMPVEAPPKPAKADAPTKPEPKPTPKPAAAKTPPPQPEPKPEYVQITRKDWDEVRAAAARTASYDSQFSKAFGTLGGLQKTLNELQAGTPRGLKVEIPKDAFADLEREFPEFAQLHRKGLEATLRGITGTGPANAEIDPEQLQRLVGEHAAKLRNDAEIEVLTDVHPDWAKIVGRVNVQAGEQPDPNNAYRKWLATKDAAYQQRLNSTNSAAVISRSITLFQSETKAPPAAPNLKAQLQAARIRDAVQPRGDGGQAAPARNDDQEFEAGFAAR